MSVLSEREVFMLKSIVQFGSWVCARKSNFAWNIGLTESWLLCRVQDLREN